MAGALQFCPVCGQECLVVKEPVYEGFTRTGERRRCAVCRTELTDPAPPPAPAGPSVFSPDDRPVAPVLEGWEEARRICRHCRHYMVNPFTQRCALHQVEVAATDTCPRFDPPAKSAGAPGASGPTGLPPLG